MPPLYQQIYQYLLDEIRSGRLGTGDRVPSEKELAERFNVSRITSKKALETLVQANVIERARGKGSFVVQELPDLARLDTRFEERASPGDEAGENRMIGVVIPDFADAYGVEMLRAIEQRCGEHGVFMLTKLTHGKREEEERAIQALTQLGVDGLIIFPVHGEYYNSTLLRLVLNNFPTVIVDRYLKGIPAQSVYTNNEWASRDLTHYLLDQGHRHIAFLSSPPENTSTLEDRKRGFTLAYTQHGLPLMESSYLTALFSTLPGALNAKNIEVDRKVISRYLQAHPEVTALVACEYNIALIARQAILSLGKRIPEDYEVACFDHPNDQFGEVLFTHIRQNETLMGTTAVDLLLEQLAGHTEPTDKIIDFQLVERTLPQAKG